MSNEELELARILQQQQMMNGGCGTPFYLVIVFIIAMFFTSCATRTKIEYRDRDVNHYITNTIHDTLKVKEKDSTYHKIEIRNDTVFDTKYVEKTRWRDKIVERHDTCYRDSVVTEYKETVKEVIKIPKIFYGSFVFSILVIIFAFVKLFRWLQTH